MSYLIGVVATVKSVVGPKRRTTTTFTEEVSTDMTGENLHQQVLRCVERVTRPVISMNEPEHLELNITLKKQLMDNLPLESGKG